MTPHGADSTSPVRFLADEDCNNDIVRGLRRRRPGVDVVRVQDVGLSGRSDPVVLEWAAGAGRVLLTHDAATLIGHALTRIRSGLPVAGVLVAPQAAALVTVIADLELVDAASAASEWVDRVFFLPLR